MLPKFLRIPPGIRTQLALWYTSVSALLLLLFGITFYWALQASLASSLDMTLQMRSQQIAEGVDERQGKLTVGDIVDELPELDATAALIDSSDDTNMSITPTATTTDTDGDNDEPINTRNVQSSLYIRVLDAKGQVVYTTTSFNTLQLPRSSVLDPLKGHPWRGTVKDVHGEEIRVYSTMLLDQSHIDGVVQVGQSLEVLNGRLSDIVWGLILITPIVLLFSAAVCYWLAGRAFRPIQRLAHTAREIEASDLHRRVPVPRPHDEVRDLALIFNQMVERLEHAFVQQRRFVADASHELRTPVAVIRNMTEVALSHPAESEDYVAVLREINVETERLGLLISDLLTLARADEGQVLFDHDAVRLDLLVTDVIESMEPLAMERHIDLSAGELQPATVVGDAARLIQVIMSLVDNAITYTNPGGKVTLSVVIDDDMALLSVRDTGIGIAPEDQKHIFERFYRADPARSRAAGGSGLGLSIVDWIVKAHNGSVRVESQVGRGSTFIVSLPLEDIARPATAPLPLLR
jgi:two-component system OmpR family sensor kinase